MRAMFSARIFSHVFLLKIYLDRLLYRSILRFFYTLIRTRRQNTPFIFLDQRSMDNAKNDK